MAKIHIVREAFGLDGIDYPRGTEITDEALLAKIKATHSHHLNATHIDMWVPVPEPMSAKLLPKSSDA